MKMRTWVAMLGLTVLALGGLAWFGTYRAGAFPAGPPLPREVGVEEARPGLRVSPEVRMEDKHAIRRAVRAYNEAYNRRDLDALVSFWSPHAEFIAENGNTVQGRDGIRAMLQQVLDSAPGSKFDIHVASLHVISPGVVREEGAVRVTTADGSVQSSRFTVLWVKEGGAWLMHTARNLPTPEAEGRSSAFGHLRQLGWMVGDWHERESGRDLALRCRWSDNQAFLIQEFTWTRDGQTVHSTQRIGWDAHNQRLRSWVHDSAGGFGEGFWTRQGNTWSVQADGVLPDGRSASSLNRWTYTDDNTCRWSSTDREADQTPLPDLEATFVRNNP